MSSKHSKTHPSHEVHPPQGYYGDMTGYGGSQQYTHQQKGQQNAVRRKPKRVKTAKHMIAQFAERTSLQGIPFILYTKSKLYKLVWVLVVLSALAGCSYQLYSISKSYFSRSTSTSVELGYTTLDFPSVTICNINPIRLSKLDQASQDMQNHLNDYAPDGEYENNEGGGNRRKRAKMGDHTRGLMKVYRKKRVLDGPEYDEQVGDDFYSDGDEDFGGTERTVNDQVRTEMEAEMGDMDPEIRRTIGHQLDLSVLDCGYQATVCNYDYFTWFLSKTYGNCYTYNSADSTFRNKTLKTRRVGSFYALDLILFVEDNEYLNIVASRGFRLDIHAYKTFPHLAEHGISLHPGTQTYIGMQLVNITRLEPPYGKCNKETSAKFYQRYGKIYTIESCNQTCPDIKIAAECECYRPENQQYYTDAELTSLPECVEQHKTCLEKVLTGVNSGTDSCDCPVPCNEQAYDLTISQNAWPSQGYWFELVDLVCGNEDNGTQQCDWLQSITDQDERLLVLRQNFINLKLYYEDLNYENVKEKQDYETSQFISDFGGTVGLWIGASFITVIELFDLLARLCARRLVPALSGHKPPPSSSIGNTSRDHHHHHQTSTSAPGSDGFGYAPRSNYSNYADSPVLGQRRF